MIDSAHSHNARYCENFSEGREHGRPHSELDCHSAKTSPFPVSKARHYTPCIERSSISSASKHRRTHPKRNKKPTTEYGDRAFVTPHRITMDIHPGKKGGDFELPGAAHLKVPEGHYGKKETITVALIPPNKRHEYCPVLHTQEKLASNVYLLHAKPDLKGTVQLQLPSNETDRTRLVALFKVGEEQWQHVSDITLDKTSCTITTASTGAFLLLKRPLSEQFTITPNGGMHNARIHHLISVRIPKRCTEFNGVCLMKIFEIEEDRIQRARSLFPRQTSDIDLLSPLYDFSFPESAVDVHFKRPVTLKLPLPDWAEAVCAEGGASELAVMIRRAGAGWEILETPLKLTKTTVTFDTKMLSRFCVIRPRKDRRMRVHLSMPNLEAANNIIRGEILLFALLEKQTWHLWAECVPSSGVVETISSRVKKGFTFLKKLPVAPPVEEESNRMNRLRNRRRSFLHRITSSNTASSVEDTMKPDDVEFHNGSTYLLSMDGDLQFKQKTSSDEELDLEIDANAIHLQFHELFDDNYRCVEIEPKPELRAKAEEFFLERVAAERAAKAKAKEREKEREKEKKEKLHNGRLAVNGRPNGTPNGTACDPYTAPMPSPTDPNDPDREGSSEETEEDIEKEMAKLVFNGSITCRPAPSDTDISYSGDLPQPGHIFARFPLSVDADDLIDYYDFQAPPEVDPEAEAKKKAAEAAAAAAAAAKEAEAAAQLQAEPVEKKAKPRPSESFIRLSQSTKQPVKLVREPKVLTGRSLQVLSRYIQHGLTLAVHLNLPDSVITGIGFDSLSNLHCLNDVTYKVLVHWKRTYGARERDKMVPDLCAALKAMELIDMAAVIADRHRNNVELTPGCFDY